ncbi:ufm1-specific protease 1-like [Gigantopelta aegis]|uniref:ufm1-specific protease 1-like n=1 Tax=Gigantopelta aegis TaxID=1735272 RepID=UPI001B887A13|nr:ufm1-specific protease 1-like [Gigantopelta aegis]XP_041352366.1 ufm1-specific protease 1-like [Gigantopelta aegis]
MTDLLVNVHEGLKPLGPDVSMVTGSYQYFHYGCDGQDDRGWGCGYRTLQTICSWIRNKWLEDGKSSSLRDVPSLPDIQAALVAMQDKPDSFCGSKQWIGTFEIFLCIDHFYNVPCRIVHVHQGSELDSHMEELYEHFTKTGSPVMMGGESDNSSKGILGVCREPMSLLVLDPHYYGKTPDKEALQQAGFVKWVPLDAFHQQSFYNLCLPLPHRS